MFNFMYDILVYISVCYLISTYEDFQIQKKKKMNETLTLASFFMIAALSEKAKELFFLEHE